MVDVAKVINELEGFDTWVQSLDNIDGKLFFTPIKEGKWSPAEIISHITYWDRYILEEMLPKMKFNANVESVEFEVMNKPAATYALSGVTKQHLIEAQIDARNNLVSALRQKDEEDFFATFTLNGETIDQYSGYPHTLFNYISAFIWHDNHHKAQIVDFLTNKK